MQVVINPDDRNAYEQAVAGLDLPPSIAGGATRQASVRAGLLGLAEAFAEAVVLIHDAARPLVSAALIDRCLDAGRSVVPALPVADSLRRAGGGVLVEAVERERLLRVQTPQCFDLRNVLAAHQALAGSDHSDDAALMMAAGHKVTTVAGDERNLKVTSAEDFVMAEALLGPSPRVGTGYDVHAFEPGDHVWIGGLRIPHDRALAGHSDADVALHALTDALLGAIAAGDIGDHFPPSDPKWRGADSSLFLEHARDLVLERGGRIEHVDITIVCEAPKIGPHRGAMRERIGALLRLSPDRVSVKATTSERLGFTGRREGIAAQAAATVTLFEGAGR